MSSLMAISNRYVGNFVDHTNRSEERYRRNEVRLLKDFAIQKSGNWLKDGKMPKERQGQNDLSRTQYVIVSKLQYMRKHDLLLPVCAQKFYTDIFITASLPS